MNITQTPANPSNYTRGRGGQSINRIIIHVQDGTQAGSISWFQNAASNVSAHYLISMAGDVAQAVNENDTAWQAGDFHVNQTSIGIEHEGQPSKGPWTPSEAQLTASAELVADLCRRYRIRPGPDTVIAHSRINPKHQCPGPTWPWPRYLDMVTRLWTPSAAHAPGVGKTTLRLFDPASNTQVGTVSLIDGTDKVYLVRKDG